MAKLDHIGILVTNLDKSIKFYKETFGCGSPKIINVDKPGLRLRMAMLPFGENYIQLVEPLEGLWLEYLKDEGEGAIAEISFQVEDIVKFYDEMKTRGVSPVDMLGNPLKDKYVLSSSGNKYLYLPRKDALGTLIEVLERTRKE